VELGKSLPPVTASIADRHCRRRLAAPRLKAFDRSMKYLTVCSLRWHCPHLHLLVRCVLLFRTPYYSPDTYNRKLLEGAGVSEESIVMYLPALAEQGMDQGAWEAVYSPELLASCGITLQGDRLKVFAHLEGFRAATGMENVLRCLCLLEVPLLHFLSLSRAICPSVCLSVCMSVECSLPAR
jgi:hypothetical protein